MISCLKVKKRESNQTLFTKNGGVLLEELIAFCNGRSNPIRHFSKKELLIATNYYETGIMADGGFVLYKGSLTDRSILVKKYNKDAMWLIGCNSYTDIAIGSQMSAHKNVLKVLGCCLETEIPTIVYEFVGTKTLYECIFDTNVEPLPWKCRVKIAIDLSNAIAYLHTAFSRPVIHRKISSFIILDQNNIPKLIDFGLCISIPEGESHVKDDSLLGSIWYRAPESKETGYITEKADVFSFGMLLIELLSGKMGGKLIEDYRNMNFNITGSQEFISEYCKTRALYDEKHFAEYLKNNVDQRMTNEGIKKEHLLDFEALISRCISRDAEKRPIMMEVGKELRRIYESVH